MSNHQLNPEDICGTYTNQLARSFGRDSNKALLRSLVIRENETYTEYIVEHGEHEIICTRDLAQAIRIYNSIRGLPAPSKSPIGRRAVEG